MPRPFKLCHTADWHLGHTLHGRSREHEHAAFLAWLVELLAEQEVDALIVAGDVFDTASPTGAAQAAFFEFLAALRRRAPAIDVVVIAGNHDSPSRLSAPDPVLRSLGVRLVGAIPWVGRGRAHRIDPEPLVLPLRARGEIAAWAAAVPYLRACDLPPEDADLADAGAAERIARGAREVYAAVARVAASRRTPDQALIVTGHCHLAGAAISGGSERAVIGGLAGVLPIDVLPAEATYVALGHLHLAQEVGGRAHVRYAGSPIPLALGEESYPHQVRIAAFEGARLVSQAAHVVPRTVPVLRVPRAGPAPLDEVLAALRALDLDPAVSDPAVSEDGAPEERWPWLEARVLLDRPEPALRARIDEAIAGRPVRLVKITVEHARGEAAEVGATSPAPRRELAELDVRDVFLRRWAQGRDDAPPADVLAAFDEACEAARSAEDGPGDAP